MTQITLAIRQAPQSERLLRWQLTVNAALAGGTLTAALLNLSALIAFSLTRSVLARSSTVPNVEAPHA